MLRHELADQPGPLLLPRHVVPLDRPVVTLQADEQRVGEVAGDAQMMKEIDTIATTTETSTNWSRSYQQKINIKFLTLFWLGACQFT